MASNLACSKNTVPPAKETASGSAVGRSGQGFRSVIIIGILVGAFLLLQSLIPLRNTVQIGADEGFEVAKATLCLHGHRLYSEVWNDQPPLHTFLITQVLKHLTSSIAGPRLVTTAFSVVLIISIFWIVYRMAGLRTGTLTAALVIASPGFLELSSSCMLEIPALATALAGLGVLTTCPPRKWYIAEYIAGVLFGFAALMKLVPLYLLPLGALILWLNRYQAIGPLVSGSGEVRSQSSSPFSKTVCDLIIRLSILGACLVGSFEAVDWLIERGAFIAHFQQSWTSHFGTVQSYEYGSPAEHGFEWGILLKNWDNTLPVLGGIGVLITQLRTNRKAILPLVWLCLSLVVFTNHKPWWSYYYLHLAIPLCWCAAVGIEAGFSFLVKHWVISRQPDRKQGKKAPFKGWQVAGAFVPAILFAICLLGWTVARVYLQIASIRNSPQIYSALVLKEIARLKPYCKWMYTDQLIYSFHADLPMPPPLAVVPLKRLWTGEMTNERIASELRAFKPEIILLRNDSREQPYQEFLETEYRLIYQDDQLRVYGQRAMLSQANAAKASQLNDANRK